MNEEKEKNEEIETEPETQPDPEIITLTDLEFETLKKEATDFKLKYLHLLADIDNAHKRIQKERQDIMKYAYENVIQEFLYPIDHLENALKHVDNASGEIKNWAFGFKMILTQFQDALTKFGVSPMESVGRTFDPHLHEAVDVVISKDLPPGTIVEESLRGYKMGDKVIRHARVKVAQREPVTPSKDESQNKENNQKSEE